MIFFLSFACVGRAGEAHAVEAPTTQRGKQDWQVTPEAGNGTRLFCEAKDL